MPTRSFPRSLARSLSVVVLGASLASGCYVGIEEDGVGEFGDELGGTDESDEGGETGDAGETSTTSTTAETSTSGDGDGDASTTGDGETSTTDSGETSTTDASTTDSGETSTTDGGTTDTGEPMAGDMPDNAYCNPVSNWSAQWIDLELEVLDLVNDARAQGGNCGANGNFPPSGPLTWEAHLTCAARVHSQDMAVNDFFDHTNLQGNGPGWRLDQAGYTGGAWGENIAAGYPDPVAVVQGWLDSDGHCSNMLEPSFTLIGVGYAYDGGSSYGNYWTQTFGN